MASEYYRMYCRMGTKEAQSLIGIMYVCTEKAVALALCDECIRVRMNKLVSNGLSSWTHHRSDKNGGI